MPRSPSDRTGFLRERAQEWAYNLKLEPRAKDLVHRLDLPSMYDEWLRVRKGLPPLGAKEGILPKGIHGVTRVRGGKIGDIEVNRADEPKRKSLALTHEYCHAFAHPEQPTHQDLHVLAAGLTTNVFPALAKAEGEGDMYDRDEMKLLSALARMNDQELQVPLTDRDLHFSLGDLWKKAESTVGKVLDPMGLTSSKGIIGRNKEAITRVLDPLGIGEKVLGLARGGTVNKEKSAGLEGAAISSQWNGWAVPLIMDMFEAQALMIPRKGIARAAPRHNITGWKAPGFAAFWQQMIASLEAGVGIAIKEYAKATAVAGVATNVALPANCRSVGLIVRISDSITDSTNEDILFQAFTGLGQVTTEWIIDLEYIKGVAEFLILHAENDRGSGIPTARDVLEITIPADGIRAGAVVSIQSINLREFQN